MLFFWSGTITMMFAIMVLSTYCWPMVKMKRRRSISNLSTWFNWIFVFHKKQREFRRKTRTMAKCRYNLKEFSAWPTMNLCMEILLPKCTTLLIKIFVHADLHMQNNRAWFSSSLVHSCVHDEKEKKKKGERNTLKFFFGLQHFISFSVAFMLLQLKNI